MWQQVVVFSTNWVMPTSMLELYNLESSGRERSKMVAWTAVMCIKNSEAQW
jgi:hypothetical protein